MSLIKQWKLIFNGMRRYCRKVAAVISPLLSTSLPNRCLMCHQDVLEGRGICRCCLSSVLYQTPSCLGCGRSLVEQTDYCGSCMKQTPLKVVAPASYHQGIGEFVAAIKYQGQLAGLTSMTTALVRRVVELQQRSLIPIPQVLVVVPLHPHRLRQRGFNQAWLIADEISRQLDIPIIDDAVERLIDTCPQEGLTGKQRRKNLAGAFKIRDDFAYQRVAIIDDVVTTGTTAQTIAQLFEQRYIHVQVWCLARAEAPGLL